MSLSSWDALKFWNSGEYQVIEERLEDLDKLKISFNPVRKLMFNALKKTPFDKTRVCIIGQDPYPSKLMCTGVAFSIPSIVERKDWPPSLVNLLKEYSRDLHLPEPTSGSLLKWCKQGVLLWNSYPTCLTGKPGSHNWTEWTYLTKEMVQELDRGPNIVVFVLLGKKAQYFQQFIEASDVICTSHPSPLGVNYGFNTSRLFSSVNSYLVQAGTEPIDWRLD